jgi:GxxExxY protein
MKNVKISARERSENDLVTVVLDVSFMIHRRWGPGLLEKVYEALLVHHLQKRGYHVEQQKAIPFVEDGIELEIGFRVDLIVENKLLVEIKSVEHLHPVFFKTVLTYLKVTDLRLGLLVNFGEPYLKDGIKRIANKFEG